LAGARHWLLDHPNLESMKPGLFILAHMVAALGIVRNVRLAWWACLVWSGFWFVVSLGFFCTIPLFPERPWAEHWVALGMIFLIGFVPSALSLWLYFRWRREMFLSMLYWFTVAVIFSLVAWLLWRVIPAGLLRW
jgi:hypothetical protein